MGMKFFGNSSCDSKSCSCASKKKSVEPIEVNPNPFIWEIIDKKIYKYAYALKVKYPNCTNFEGVKIMVFKGTFDANIKAIDPHFLELDEVGVEIKNILIARLRPISEGWLTACMMAKGLHEAEEEGING